MALGMEGFGYLRNIIKLAPEVKEPCHSDGRPLKPSSSPAMEEGILACQVSNAEVGTFRPSEEGEPDVGTFSQSEEGERHIQNGDRSIRVLKGLSKQRRGSLLGSGSKDIVSTELLERSSKASRRDLCDSSQSESEDPPDSARSLSSFLSVSSSIEQQVETLEVQLAIKEAEIRRLAEVFSGTEVALLEREKEAQHLSALAYNLEEQIATKNEVLELSQELIGSLEERLLALEVQRDSLEARESEYAQSVQALSEEAQRLLADVNRLEQEQGAAVSKIEELTSQIKGLEKRLVEGEDENASLRARLQDAKKSAGERVEGLTRKLVRLQKRLSEATDALRVSTQTVSDLKQQVLDKDTALTESKAGSQVQSESLRVLERQGDALSKDVLRKEGNLEAVKAHVADLERQLDEKERECSKAHASVNGLLVQLEAKHTSAQAEIKGMRTELELERTLRVQVEEQLSAKEVELEAACALIQALKKDLARGYNQPMRLGQLPAPSTSSAESTSSQEQPCTEDLCKQPSDSSWMCEDTDAESVASVQETIGSSQLTLQGGPSLAALESAGFTGQCDAVGDAKQVPSASLSRTPCFIIEKAVQRAFSRRCSREESDNATAFQGLKVLLVDRPIHNRLATDLSL